MMVFWQQRLAFLATPKTASTAIEQALGALAALVIQRPAPLKHTSLTRFDDHLQPWLTTTGGARFETAALMREPREWLGSWYRDRQREDVEPEKSTRGISFDDFVRAHCQTEDRPLYADVGSQAAFLTRADGSQVDHLFRYDHLAAFVQFLEDRLNCEIHLPRMNVSPLGDTSLTPATEARLHEARAADFALYEQVQDK